MSPMNETELRQELARVDVGYHDDFGLSHDVIDRGRRVRRRRTVAVTAAFVLLAGGGIGIAASAWMPRQTIPASPVPSVSVPAPLPTESPGSPDATSPAATLPTWTDTRRLPDRFGDVTGLKLPLDAETSTEWRTVEPHENYPISCGGQRLAIDALRKVVAGRNLTSSGQESFDGQAVLRFASAADAESFMNELWVAARDCSQRGPSDPEPSDLGMVVREASVFADGFGEIGDESFAFGTYTEASEDGGRTWTPFFGAGLSVWARQGDRVALAEVGGEMGGGNLFEDAGLVAELTGVARAILAG